jgi:hypothetical protein
VYFRGKWPAPAGNLPNRGCRLISADGDLSSGIPVFGKRTRKPNSVYAVIPLGAALPRALISDLPGGFGHYADHPATKTCRSGPRWSSLSAPGRHRARTLLRIRASLPIWSCSVWGLPCRRHYCRRGALLPHLFTLTIAWSSPLDQVRRYRWKACSKGCSMQWRYVFCGTSRPRALTPASRTLSGTLPCGVRTFLSRQPCLRKNHRQRPPGPPARV